MNLCSFTASILHELPENQQTMNSVKVEHPNYYCNSYAAPDPVTAVGSDRASSVDPMVVSAAYCTLLPITSNVLCGEKHELDILLKANYISILKNVSSKHFVNNLHIFFNMNMLLVFSNSPYYHILNASFNLRLFKTYFKNIF